MVTPTHRAGSFRHPGDEPLLLAGCLLPVALVLVRVPVGAAHGDVVFVALQTENRCSGTSSRPAPPSVLSQTKGPHNST